MSTIFKIGCLLLGLLTFIVFPSTVEAKQKIEPEIELIGKVVKKSELPDPSTAAYPNCLTFLKFKVVKVINGRYDNGDILVAMWGFKDHKLSEPGTFQVGDVVKLQLLRYKKVENELSSIMRVDDTQDYDSELYWSPTFEIQNKQHNDALKSTTYQGTEQERRKTKVTETVLKILKAHDGQFIGGRESKEAFGHYGYLTTENFWEPAAEKSNVREIGILAAIIDFHEYLKSKNIQLVVVVPPSAIVLYPDIAANVDYDFNRDGRIDVNFFKFKEALRNKGVFCVDLVPELISKKWFQGPDGQIYPIYHQYDMHWNDVGASLSGNIVAKAIRETPWFNEITSSYPPKMVHYQESFRIGTFENKDDAGDHPEWKYPPTKYPMRTIIPDRMSGFIMNSSGPQAPVWLLGDSFSQYPAFLQSISAGLGLPVNVVASGFGSATPVREEFARTKNTSNVKIVIWEIASPTLMYKPIWKEVIFNRNLICDLQNKLPQLQANSGAVKLDNISILDMTREGIGFTRLDDTNELSAPATVTLEKVKLGNKPVFSSAIGLELTNPKAPDGARFEVLANGKVVAAQTLERRASAKIRDSWRQTWDVDLSAYAGKTINLQLRIVPLSTWNGAQVYWGNPTISNCNL